MQAIKDIITLFGAGYTMEELRAMDAETRANTAALLAAGLTKEDAAAAVELLAPAPPAPDPAPEPDPQPSEHDQDPAPEPDPQPSEHDQDQPDYKALYEETLSKLQEAYRQAAREPAGEPQPERTAENVLQDMVKQYIY